MSPLLEKVAAALFSVLVVSVLQYVRYRRRQVNVPAIGESGLFGSYRTAQKYITNAPDLLREGYAKYPNGAFKIPHPNGWFVVVSGRKLIDELKDASDELFGHNDATDDTLHITKTVGPEIFANIYHVPVVRNQLTRNLGNLSEDVKEEVTQAFQDFIPQTEDWTTVSAFERVIQIVSRASNRVFIGLPACRNPDWTHLSIHFTEDVVQAGNTLSRFPSFLHSIISKWQGVREAAVKKAVRIIGPMVEERLRMFEQYGTKWPDKPNDMLSWLIDEATEDQRNVESLCLRLLFVNFAALHTSGMAFTQALYYLAAYPEYMEPLREEVEEVTTREGWGKSALGKLHKVDSFLKESARLNPAELISLKRKTLKDVTLSDGTFLPKGTHVSIASFAIHLDPDVWENPETFDGFRFSRMREALGEGHSMQAQYITTSPDFLSFGHGRHACPGRFFAAQELKLMLSEVVLNYDVKMEGGKDRPSNFIFGMNVAPDVTAKVMFRKRRA